MPNSQPLDLLPTWSIYLLTVVILILAIEAGFRLGKFVQKRWPDKSETGVGAMVGAALALLGFLLAFVTSIALENFNQRRQLVVQEANAIGTAYLEAGLLAEPFVQESRQLLREYVDQRLAAVERGQLATAIARSEQIHHELWSRAEAAGKATPTPTVSLYISSLIHVIDLHTERLDAELGFRVPQEILFGLYIVAVITMMLVGVYNSYGEKRNFIALAMVVLIMSVVFLLIVDLDRSHVGIVTISQQALIDLQRELNSIR